MILNFGSRNEQLENDLLVIAERQHIFQACKTNHISDWNRFEITTLNTDCLGTGFKLY